MVTTDAQKKDVQEQDSGRLDDGSPEPVDPAATESGKADHEADAAGPDARCSAAVDLARDAAERIADPGTVGDHLGVIVEEGCVVTHRFVCASRGYRGWHWAVTVARAPGSEDVTVSETVLLPGGEAVLSPAWVPWSDRLQPGDLGAADVLPRRPDDPNLVPGLEQIALEYEDDADQLQFWELGLGRVRVLGPQGRESAVHRWYSGAHGPIADESVYAASACAACGYFVPLAGALRQVFGVCANEWSASDGQVVSVDHGCGAHSETDLEQPEPISLPEPILDELGAEEVVVLREDASEEPAAPVADAEPESGPEPEPAVPAAEVAPEPVDAESESTAPEPAVADSPAAGPESEPTCPEPASATDETVPTE